MSFAFEDTPRRGDGQRHPWWRAELDGHPTEILKANVLFRAVQVGPGIHRVHFAFEPLQGAREKLKEPGTIRMMADTDARTRW